MIINKQNIKSNLKGIVALGLSSLIICSSITPAFCAETETVKSNISSLKNELNSINSNLVKINDEILSTVKKIESHGVDMFDMETQLKSLEEKQTKQYSEMKGRVKYMYENGNIALLKSAVESSSLGEVLSKAEYISNITNYDKKKLEEIVNTAKKIEQEHIALQKEQDSLTSLKEELASKQAKLQSEANKTNGDLSSLTKKLAALQEAEANKISNNSPKVASAPISQESVSNNAPAKNNSEPVPQTPPAPASSNSSEAVNIGFVPGPDALTKSKGVTHFNGHRETYYSQKVLPGTGLNIPGRHVGAYDTVRDENNYLCLASNDYPKGTVVSTSLGLGKVYDCGCASGTIDIYVNW